MLEVTATYGVSVSDVLLPGPVGLRAHEAPHDRRRRYGLWSAGPSPMGSVEDPMAMLLT
jgi:hypothetical protein